MTTITTCDICGEHAATTRKVDVCEAHSLGSAVPKKRGAPKGTKHPPINVIECAICGKQVKEGAGYSAHRRRAHPDDMASPKSSEASPQP